MSVLTMTNFGLKTIQYCVCFNFGCRTTQCALFFANKKKKLSIIIIFQHYGNDIDRGL
jgi:hypothetical protein